MSNRYDYVLLLLTAILNFNHYFVGGDVTLVSIVFTYFYGGGSEEAHLRYCQSARVCNDLTPTRISFSF
jgi:hypothetical protein